MKPCEWVVGLHIWGLVETDVDIMKIILNFLCIIYASSFVQVPIKSDIFRVSELITFTWNKPKHLSKLLRQRAALTSNYLESFLCVDPLNIYVAFPNFFVFVFGPS